MNVLPVVFSLLFMLSSCNDADDSIATKNETELESNESAKASIVSVTSTGTAGAYVFSVGIASPDTGCDQYANWWEVISEDGSTLIYRRILGHSHVNEQPFVRSGGTVTIDASQMVIIRAHMNTSGYGINVFRGSVSTGFKEDTLAENFADNLSMQQPLPTNCAF
ncbi:hypothetical protein ACKGJY_07255 [Hyunsoonleella sp. 2307UL5-6]|uniref:hypothetical protein n=1 Tax=Hyunsoonleella sp. 2307UL5-6 TaxID=3384768 RepID=UPI0039BD28FC